MQKSSYVRDKLDYAFLVAEQIRRYLDADYYDRKNMAVQDLVELLLPFQDEEFRKNILQKCLQHRAPHTGIHGGGRCPHGRGSGICKS